MKKYFLLTAAFVFFAVACTQRTEPPPANRDGIAGGSNTPKTGTPSNGKEDPAGFPDEDDFGPDYVLGANEFTVLMGRFSAREEAEELAFALRQKRINNFIEETGGEWLVCVGRYSSVNGAKSTLKVLRQKGYAEAELYGPGHPY